MKALAAMLSLLLIPAVAADPIEPNLPDPGLPPIIDVGDPVAVLFAAADAAQDTAEDAAEDVTHDAETVIELAEETVEAVSNEQYQVVLDDPDYWIFLREDGNTLYTASEYASCTSCPTYDKNVDYLTGFRHVDSSQADGGIDVAVVFAMAYEYPLTSPNTRLFEGAEMAVDHTIIPDIYVGPACGSKPVGGGVEGLGVWLFQGAGPCTGLGTSFSGLMERIG